MQHLDTETLSSYIDGELPAAEIAQVEAHLASCTQCDREYTELLGVSRMVRDLPTYQPRSSARVRSSSGGSRPERVISLTRYLRPVTVAAIVIIVAVTGLRILAELTDSEPDEGNPVQFAQDQENGTDSDRQSSQSVADAPDAASDSSGQPPLAAVPRNDQSGAEQEARFDDVSESAEPGSAAMAPTAEAVVAAPTETTDDTGDGSGWSVEFTVRTGLYVLLGTAIVAVAIWLSHNRTRQRQE